MFALSCHPSLTTTDYSLTTDFDPSLLRTESALLPFLSTSELQFNSQILITSILRPSYSHHHTRHRKLTEHKPILRFTTNTKISSLTCITLRTFKRDKTTSTDLNCPSCLRQPCLLRALSRGATSAVSINRCLNVGQVSDTLLEPSIAIRSHFQLS